MKIKISGSEVSLELDISDEEVEKITNPESQASCPLEQYSLRRLVFEKYPDLFDLELDERDELLIYKPYYLESIKGEMNWDYHCKCWIINDDGSPLIYREDQKRFWY